MLWYRTSVFRSFEARGAGLGRGSICSPPARRCLITQTRSRTRHGVRDANNSAGLPNPNGGCGKRGRARALTSPSRVRVAASGCHGLRPRVRGSGRKPAAATPSPAPGPSRDPRDRRAPLKDALPSKAPSPQRPAPLTAPPPPRPRVHPRPVRQRAMLAANLSATAPAVQPMATRSAGCGAGKVPPLLSRDLTTCRFRDVRARGGVWAWIGSGAGGVRRGGSGAVGRES